MSMTTSTGHSIPTEQQDPDSSNSTEPNTSVKSDNATSSELTSPSLLYLTLTLLPDDQDPNGRPILPGIHSPDEVAHFFPMFREGQLDEVRSHLSDWIAEYEQVLAQRQIERAKAEAVKPKPSATSKPKSSMNQRPDHVQSSSKPIVTKEARGTQRSLFDLSS